MLVAEAIANLQAVGDALAASKKLMNLQDRQLLAKWKDAKAQVRDALAEAAQPAITEELKPKKSRKAKEETVEESPVVEE
jgi:hypothetical protein